PRGVSGNPGGRPRERPHLPTCRALASQFSEDIIAGLLDLAWTAENEHVRLGALIELGNRADGKPRLAKEEDDDEPERAMTAEEFERAIGETDEDEVPETPPQDETEKQEDVQANGSRFTELELDEEAE